jgi:hypothetical protein
MLYTFNDISNTFSIAVTPSGTLNTTLVLQQNTGTSCIDLDIIDDNIALEDPEEFIWTLQPVPVVPRVQVTSNATRVFIIDNDRRFIAKVKLVYHIIIVPGVREYYYIFLT